jgi:hypothetical protein
MSMFETDVRNVLTIKMVVTDPESLQMYVCFQIYTQTPIFFSFVHGLQCFSDLYTDLNVFQICAQTSVFFRFIHNL